MKKFLATFALTVALVAAPLVAGSPALAATSQPAAARIAINPQPVSINEKNGTAQVQTSNGLFQIAWMQTAKATKTDASQWTVLVLQLDRPKLVYTKMITKTGALAILKLLKQTKVKAQLGHGTFSGEKALVKALQSAVKGHTIKTYSPAK